MMPHTKACVFRISVIDHYGNEGPKSKLFRPKKRKEKTRCKDLYPLSLCCWSCPWHPRLICIKTGNN
jgi:hypothetical protein